MDKQRNDLKAGIFILVTFAIAVAIVVRIRHAEIGSIQFRTVAFDLSDDIGGLREGDEVRLGGYKVGIIRGVRLSDPSAPHPKLLMSISLPSSYLLHRDAVVVVQTGLTGESDLNIQSLGSGEPLPDSESLVGRPDPKSALFASLGSMGPHLQNAIAMLDTQSIPKVNDAVDSAKSLLKHAEGKVDPVVDRYNKVADNASAAMGQINDLMGDTKPDIRGTLKHLNEVSSTLKDKLPGLLDQITAAIKKVDGSLTTAQAALLDIQKTAANAQDTTSTLRSVIVGNRGKLEGMIGSLKTTSDNLKEASVELRHSPWRLLYKPTPGEAANMNLYDSAREFADGAGSLSDAATALRDALHDPQADRAQIQKLVHELDASFTHFQQVESKLWATARQ